MKKLCAIALLVVISTQAHAGLWDSITEFFGGSDETETSAETTKEVATEVATDAKESAELSTAGMMEKGLELLPMLTQSLNISDAKALGGMGSILQAVKGIMPGDDYSSLLKAIPNASSFLGAAPKVDTSANKDDTLGSVMAAAGELSDKAKSLNTLNSQFDSLGLSMDMAPKFADTAQKYLKDSGNDSASDLLTSAIGKLF